MKNQIKHCKYLLSIFSLRTAATGPFGGLGNGFVISVV